MKEGDVSMRIFAAVAMVVGLAGPALAGETLTVTPELALPEPEMQSYSDLPHSSVTETAPLALPEPETEAVAPYKRCGDRETVYLTN
jgi:hypothetical protein